MKRLTCEMCGSTELMKDGGVFICQVCGCKYSVEEAKRMMVEGTVEVRGVVKVANTAQISNLMNMAQSAFSSKNYAKAEKFCDQVISMDDKNHDAWMLKGSAINYQINANNPRILEAYNCLMTSYRVLGDDCTDVEKRLKTNKILYALNECMISEVRFWVRQIELGRPTDKSIAKAKLTHIDCYNKLKAAYEEMGVDVDEVKKTLKRYNDFFCTVCYGASLNAWESTVAYNYFRQDLSNFGKNWNRNPKKVENGTDYFRPNKEIWRTFMDETQQLIDLLKYCIQQFNDETPFDIQKGIYAKISDFYDISKDQVIYKAMVRTTTNGYGAVIGRREYYEVDGALKEEYVRSYAQLANEYKIKENAMVEKIKEKERQEREEKARKEREEKEKRIVEYWKTHADEKATLEAEKSSLEEQVAALNEEGNKIPGASEIANIQERIATMTTEKKALSFFKGKEKKALQEKIDAANAEERNISDRMAAAKKEIEKKIDSLQKRIDAINTELTKAR